MKQVKYEGQSFDIGFITVHQTAESFIAQGKKQKLFAKLGEKKQEALLKTIWDEQTAKHGVQELVTEPVVEKEEKLSIQKLRKQLKDAGIPIPNGASYEDLVALLPKQGEEQP